MKSLKEIREVEIEKDFDRHCWHVKGDYGINCFYSKNFKTKKSCINHFKQFCKVNGIDFTKIKIKEN